jgi:hypothetical protein
VCWALEVHEIQECNKMQPFSKECTGDYVTIEVHYLLARGALAEDVTNGGAQLLARSALA